MSWAFALEFGILKKKIWCCRYFLLPYPLSFMSSLSKTSLLLATSAETTSRFVVNVFLMDCGFFVWNTILLLSDLFFFSFEFDLIWKG